MLSNAAAPVATMTKYPKTTTDIAHSDKHPTPSCMDNADWDMYPDGGHMCQAWQAKETANA